MKTPSGVPELNLCNYDSDDVENLNTWAIEADEYIKAAALIAAKEQSK